MSSSSLDANTKAVFDSAASLIKHQITISSAAIAVLVSVYKLAGKVTGLPLVMLIGSWVSFLLSILLGVMAHMAVTYQLGRANPSIAHRGLRQLAVSQSILFIVGIAATVCYGTSLAVGV